MKPVEFVGSSLQDLRSFPKSVVREAGYQIDRVQNGLLPDETGTYRVIYVAKLEQAVFVLHCFQKKTQKTSQKDLNLAVKRYKDLMKEFGR